MVKFVKLRNYNILFVFAILGIFPAILKFLSYVNVSFPFTLVLVFIFL